MMKRLFSLILAACLVLLAGCDFVTRVRDFDRDTVPTVQFVPSAETQVLTTEPTQVLTTEPVESTITPVLYKVTDEAGNAVWLFGSIHVGLDSFYPLPAYVLDAYENADALAVECDVVAFGEDMGAQVSALQGMIYTDGTKISDHIPEELYNRSVEVLEEAGLYMSMLDMYKPVLWSSFIDTALYEAVGANSELGIDLYFLNDAHATGREILEVESVQFQYDMLSGFSEELQILMLEGSVYSYDTPDESFQQINELIDVWASGDGDALAALLAEETAFESEEERLLYVEYNDAMMVQRNLAMADYAEEALASGKEVFICVGAAHVVGEGAMADLLAQRGYTVERITP